MTEAEFKNVFDQIRENNRTHKLVATERVYGLVPKISALAIPAWFAFLYRYSQTVGSLDGKLMLPAYGFALSISIIAISDMCVAFKAGRYTVSLEKLWSTQVRGKKQFSLDELDQSTVQDYIRSKKITNTLGYCSWWLGTIGVVVFIAATFCTIWMIPQNLK